MNKAVNLLLLLLLCIASISLSAQKNHEIKGTIVDSLGEPLLASTIMLLDMDSTFVDFSRSDLDGTFKFKKVPNGDHILKITFVGMIPVNMNVSSQGEAIDLGQIKMQEIPSELMEIVIKAAKAPIKLRGDTIEYDATTFKVPEGSTVEDLLRRLPGLDIDQDGGITADGQDVTKVTVDGKEFFGGDPKAATKNLEAEGISKVQVFDKKSEEEEITGDNSKINNEKTLNLELKDSHKDGAFGKISAGYGTEERAEIKGNYNRFNDKIQLSLIAGANNTGRNGLSWDDYQSFMGSRAFRFGDDGEYGFGGGMGPMIVIGGSSGDNDLESDLQSIFFSGNSNGLPNNANGGINFSYDHKKTKLSSYYFLNKKGLTVDRSGTQERFLDSGNVLETNSSLNVSDAIGQKGQIKWEQEIDSFHTIELKTQIATLDNNIDHGGKSVSKFKQNDFNTNSTDQEYDTESGGYLVNGRFLLKKKFRSSKRRRAGLNASYQYSTLDTDQEQRSVNTFFDALGATAQDAINQNYDNALTKTLLKANALYVEPLSEKLTLQFFYNHSTRAETGIRDVVDVAGGVETVNTFLTRDYENDIQLNRGGAQVRYGHNGINFSVGAAYQSFVLDGVYEGASGSGISGVVDNTYNNWIPHASMSFSPFRNGNLNISYNVSAQEPSIRNLQPIVDNSNPLYLREGNPDLTPQISHAINTGLSYFKPLSGFRVFGNIRYTYYKDQIITRETITPELVTQIKPENYSGGKQISSFMSAGFPLIKRKLKMDIGGSVFINESNAFVNDVLNSTSSANYSPNIGLDITLGKDFSLYIDSRFGFTDTKYNINTTQNQKSQSFTHSVKLNTALPLGLTLDSRFSLSMYRNDRLNLSQDVPILNVSLSRKFLKGNKGEIRLSLYDAFNKNVGINQFASNYFISQSRVETLARYAMASFTYNLKGPAKKRGGMMFH